MDPFAMALDAQFNAPGSMAAEYISADGEAVPIRIIRSQADEEAGFPESPTVVGTDTILIRRSDAIAPMAGDTVVAENLVSFRLVGIPRIDVEGMTWSCPAALLAP